MENKWYKVAAKIDDINFNANGLAEIDIQGKIICIARHNNRVFACTQKCPHAGGSLAEGYIDVVGNLVCPLHKYKFSLKNGRNISGEGYYLKTFRLEEKKDGVFVCLEDPLF
jgi:nitrite reductase/ring-hydroxylating ferredoxin subunit